MSHTDRDLFRLIADQHERAFNHIYKKYHPVLFSRIRRFVRQEEDARDLTQNVFINLWQHGAPLKEVRNPAAWLNRTAANSSINHLRQRYVRRNMEALAGGRIISLVESDQDLSYQHLIQLILAGLEELPVVDRNILRLHLDSGYGPKRLAVELELPEGSVKKKLETSRKFLREYIQSRLGVWLPWVVIVAGLLRVVVKKGW